MCRMIVGSVGIVSGTMPNRFSVVNLVVSSLHPWKQMGTTRDDHGCQDCQHIHIPHTQHTKVLPNNLNWSIPAQFQPNFKANAVSWRSNPCRDQLHTQYRPIVPRLKHPLNACADLRAPGCETATYARCALIIIAKCSISITVLYGIRISVGSGHSALYELPRTVSTARS